MKKCGFGQGKWNGFGGKVEEGETIEEATVREMREEAGVGIRKMNRSGIIEFEYQGNNPEIMEVHIFRVREFEGIPTESEEMKPKWFHVDEIPFEEMWPDDKHWIPLFLQGKKFRGKFFFDKTDNIVEYKLSEVEDGNENSSC
jgi:8-oxo-dGTP diphosphatase/2-hydroxy-dATP diphosphatase